MPARATRGEGPGDWRSSAFAFLALLALLSPGAWLITKLPPVPAAKALSLVACGIWLLAAGAGILTVYRPDRRIAAGMAILAASVAAAFIAGGDLFAVAFYDLFSDMPLVQWLAFPVVFVLAASLRPDRRLLGRAMSAVVVASVVISVGIIMQRTSTGATFAFGSTAYSVTALAPMIPLGVALAISHGGAPRVLWLCAAAVVAAALAIFSGSVMGALAVVFAVVVSAGLLFSAFRPEARIAMVGRRIAVSVALALTVGMIFVQVPLLSGSLVSPESVAALGDSAVSRAYMWEGAQAMVAEKTLLGFGPSGYRTAAVEYLDPGALQYGADRVGNADPTVYSPQSPHSLLWEIATRMGVLGLAAFAVMFALWAFTLRDRLKPDDDTAPARLALAAAFVTALFALLVNPVVFPIGLFCAVTAGLAVSAAPGAGSPAGIRARVGMAAAGILVVVISAWLYSGEWSAYTNRSDDYAVLAEGYEAALAITPGHPMIERRMLENRVVAAVTDADLADARAAVEAAPEYISAYAPNLVNFAAYSLTQADMTGRTDVEWERGLLDEAAMRLPTIPSLVAEQLHLALVQGDVNAVSAALPAAREWGRPYPFTESYVVRAEALLGLTD